MSKETDQQLRKMLHNYEHRKPPKRPRKKINWRRIRRSQGFRLISTGLGFALLFIFFIGMSSVVQNPEGLAELEAGPEVSATPVTIDEYGHPLATPTPAVYAPFGAQYGYGGAELLPETPVPTAEPTAEPTPTPVPTAVPTPSPETYSTLRKGSNGQAVVRMQEALKELGYLEGTADGSFGAGTESAVKMFQAINALTADGIAGAKTLKLLYSGEARSAAEAPEMDYLILVNRNKKLDTKYMPPDLVKVESVIPSDYLKVKYQGTMANRVAVNALYEMLKAAKADGLSNFQLSSAFRTGRDQQKLVDNSVKKYLSNNPDWSRQRALSATYNTVAPVGTSEHQTGLSFDITVPGVSFSGTEQQKWLHAHCAEYGFVVRFTKDKQSKTGFVAESWHFRYVGKEAAAIMTRNNWCLEEYCEHMGLN